MLCSVTLNNWHWDLNSLPWTHACWAVTISDEVQYLMTFPKEIFSLIYFRNITFNHLFGSSISLYWHYIYSYLFMVSIYWTFYWLKEKLIYWIFYWFERKFIYWIFYWFKRNCLFACQFHIAAIRSILLNETNKIN